MAKLLQWVNLPKDAKYVEDEITSIERVGPVHLTCEFKKAKLAHFRVQVKPKKRGNARYSRQERSRNPNFKVRYNSSQTNTSAKKVKLEMDVYLEAAGGNRYTIKAKYRKKVVQATMLLETRRRLYYQVINMTTVPVPASMATFEEAFKNTGDKFYIMIKEKGGRPSFPLIPVLKDTSHTAFRNGARSVYAIQQYEPYAVALVFSNYISNMAELEFIDSVDRNVSSWLSRWGAYEATVELTDAGGRSKYLWYDLDPADDAAKEWFISAEFHKTDGTVIRLSADDVTIDFSSKSFPLGGYNKIKVNFQILNFGNIFTSLTGRLHIKVNVVSGFTGGFSYNSLNMITTADKAWWRQNSEAKKFQICNHELGHKVGMVADGQGRAPDAPPHLYGENRGVNDKGHRGPHCENGATYNAATNRWSGNQVCVMFGSTGIMNPGGYRATPPDFCGDCAPVVRKLDLEGSQLPGLANRF